MLYILLALFLLACFIGYKYYFKPKAEIKRYVRVFKSLGYTVYEQPFQFFGLSVVFDYERGKKLHKDAMYYERTVYSQVDIAIGNILDNVALFIVNPFNQIIFEWKYAIQIS
jgi:hypothetical protein